MRSIFDKKEYDTTVNQTNLTVQETQINQLQQDVANLNELIDQANQALEDYKTEINTGINTGDIKADNITADAITLNTLNLKDLDLENLTVEQKTQLKDLIADQANLTEAFIKTLNSDSADITDITSNNITVATLNAKTVNIEEWAIDNLKIDTLETTDFVTETVTAVNIKADEITTTDAEIDNLKSTDATIENLTVENAVIDNQKIININWDQYQDLIDQDDFVIKIPYFENGTYYYKITDENTTYATMEISNSVGAAYTVAWGQIEEGWLTKIYISEDNHLYIQCYNKAGSALKIYYAAICSDTPDEVLGTFDKLPVYPEQTFNISSKNGTKFYNNVVTPMSDPQSLTVSTSSEYSQATDKYSYDLSEKVNAVVYKPNQSLNKTDTVDFYEVHAPVLDVADLSVSSTLDAPHIKDMPLNSSSLPDGEYLSFGAKETNGTIDGFSFSLFTINNYNDPLSSNDYTFYRGVSDTLQHLVENNLYSNNGGQYSVSQGVTITNNITKNQYYVIPPASLKQSCIVKDDNNYWVFKIASNNAVTLSAMKANGLVISTDHPYYNGSLTIDNLFDSDDELINQNISKAPTAVNSIFFIKDDTGNYIKLTVIMPDADMLSIPSVTYTKVDNSDSHLQRVLVDNGTSTTTNIAVTPTSMTKKDQPLRYNETTKELEYTDELTLNTLTVEGDTTVNGDLYVKGTTHTTNTEDVVASGDTLVLRANNDMALGSGQVSGIVVNKYDGNQDLNLVTDNEGTLRVGTGSGTDTTYNNVLFDSTTNKWYNYTLDSDNKVVLGSVVNVNGTVTSWTNRRVENTYTVYDSITATVIDKTTLVPLLGRAEDADLDNNSILKYDKPNLKAVKASNSDIANAAVAGISDSTADITDTEKLITQTGTNNPVKKTFSKVWSYILGKIKGLSTSTADVADTDTLISQTGTNDPVKKSMSVFWSWVAKKIQQNAFTNTTNSGSPWFSMSNSNNSGDVYAAESKTANNSIQFGIGSGHADKGMYVHDANGNTYWLIRSNDAGKAIVDAPQGLEANQVTAGGTINNNNQLTTTLPGTLPVGTVKIYQVSNVTNAPGTTHYGVLLCLNTQQIYYESTTDKVFIRHWWNPQTSWSAWKDVTGQPNIFGGTINASNPASNTNPPLLGQGEIKTYNVYNSPNMPATYGNIINIGGQGQAQIFLEWSGSQTSGGQNVNQGIWFRSSRDNQSTWTAWSKVAMFDSNGNLNVPGQAIDFITNIDEESGKAGLYFIKNTADVDKLFPGMRQSYKNLLVALINDASPGLLLLTNVDEMAGMYFNGDTVSLFNPGDRNSLNFYDTDSSWNNSNITQPTWAIDEEIATGVVLPQGEPSNVTVGSMWLA